jgi:peptide/nickel transport system permease protein
MAVTLLRNLLRSVAVLLTVTFATFALMYGNGSGIARAVLGVNATEDQVQQEVTRLGLDRPLLIQYWSWLRGAATGDLGRSFFTGETVTNALSTRVPVTLSLVFFTLVLMLVLSVLLGVASALYGGWLDRTVQLVAVGGAAIQPYVIGIVLVFTFAVVWRLFPATGYVPPTDSVTGWLASIALPVVALLIGSVANAASQFRSAVHDTLQKDFVRTLRARGIKESHIVFRHVLRNASGPGLIVLSLGVIALFGGAIFVEQIFALPGLGQLAASTAQLGDVPMVMGAILVTIVVILAVNFLADLAGAALNPKARLQ